MDSIKASEITTWYYQDKDFHGLIEGIDNRLESLGDRIVYDIQYHFCPGEDESHKVIILCNTQG